MSTRKTPVRHPVTGYKRLDGRYVNAYWRGKGNPPRKTRRIVQETKPFIQISAPVSADVTKTSILSHSYDYKEKVSRPVSFQATLITADEVKGHEDEEWLAAFIKMFPTLDNSLREGYTVKNVMVSHSPYAWDEWKITLQLKKGASEIDTKDVEREVVKRIAQATELDVEVGEDEPI